MNIVTITGANPNEYVFIPRYPQSANTVVNSEKREDEMMFALMITALLVLIATISFAVVADCGLRWWSAFGQLQSQLRLLGNDVEMPRIRAYSTPYRGTGACGALSAPKQRAAA